MLIIFKKKNNIKYYHNHSDHEGIPYNVIFKVKKYKTSITLITTNSGPLGNIPIYIWIKDLPKKIQMALNKKKSVLTIDECRKKLGFLSIKDAIRNNIGCSNAEGHHYRLDFEDYQERCYNYKCVYCENVIYIGM